MKISQYKLTTILDKAEGDPNAEKKIQKGSRALLRVQHTVNKQVKIEYDAGIKKIDSNTFASDKDKNLFFQFLKELSSEELEALRDPKHQ